MLEVSQGHSTRGMGGVKPDGTFAIWRLDPGKYILRGRWNQAGRMLLTAPVEIEVTDSNLDNIELPVVPPSDIAGRVEYEDEQARQGPQPPPQPAGRPPVQFPRTMPRRLMLQGTRGELRSQPADIAEDGSFRLEAVQPGRYRVTYMLRPAFVKSMRLGDSAIEGNLLDVRHGSGGASLTVLVSSATAEISGTVSDGQGPAAGARVALVHMDDEGTSFPAFASAGEDGSYHFTGIAPGKYRLAALDDDDSQAMQGNLDDYEDILENLDLQSGDKLSKDLKRHPQGK